MCSQEQVQAAVADYKKATKKECEVTLDKDNFLGEDMWVTESLESNIMRQFTGSKVLAFT